MNTPNFTPDPSENHRADALRSSYRFSAAPVPPKSTAPTTVPPSPSPSPTRPTTRPRGRLLIAGLMLAACGAGIFTVWESLMRYKAYGVVTGRIIHVSAPVDGVLKYVHVREGDVVRQDCRLATVFDLEYEQRLGRVADELKVAESTLHAEIAKVQWTSHVQETEMTKSLAEFYEGAGTLHAESGALGVIRNELARTHSLVQSRAGKENDLRNQTIQEGAQKDKLAAIQLALNVLKERAHAAASVPRLGSEQVAPLVAKVDMLLNETDRIREWIAQGDLRAPVNGRILSRHHPAGECIKSHETLFSVIEESSLEIEMFLPQDMTADFEVGDTMPLRIEPFEELVPCEVTSIGGEHRQPPANIEVFYRKSVKLLPVRVRPAPEFAADRRMSVGAVAKLPHFSTPL